MDTIVKRLMESRKVSGISDKVRDISSEIHQAIQAGVKKVMTSPSFGFPENEVEDYSQVDATFTDGYLMIEVRAEVSYDGLMELCDELNPTVEYYDDESYFEPVTGGIIAAYLEVAKLEKIEEAVDTEDKEELTMEFASDEDAEEFAKENDYKIQKDIKKFDGANISHMKKSVTESSEIDPEILLGMLKKLRTEATEALYKYEELDDIGECRAILMYLAKDSKSTLDYINVSLGK